MNYTLGLERLRHYLKSRHLIDKLQTLESLALQLSVAQEAYFRFRGPASREELFIVLDALTQFSLEVTGENLQYWCETPSYETTNGVELRTNHYEEDFLIQFSRSIILLERNNTYKETTTGFFINPDKGYILSCNHFFRLSNECYTYIDSWLHTCRIIRRVPKLDMALLKLEGDPETSLAHISKPTLSSDFKVNDRVICIGRRPQGYLSTRTAFISNVSVVISDYHVRVPVVELDTALHPGFSGSPIYKEDMKELLGVAMARIVEIGGVKEPGTAIMLPVDYIHRWTKDIEKEVEDVVWIQ